jgi:hypothetical protein
VQQPAGDVVELPAIVEIRCEEEGSSPIESHLEGGE